MRGGRLGLIWDPTGSADGSARRMPLVRDPQPLEFEALLERRHALGQDVVDEAWEGVYVVKSRTCGGARTISEHHVRRGG
jgi:hypothetical protein